MAFCSNLLTLQDLKNVRDFLHGVAVKWYDIGIELELDIGELQSIEQRYRGDTGACLREMLIVWLKSLHPPPTRRALANALRARAVGEAALAEQGTPLCMYYSAGRNSPVSFLCSSWYMQH